MKRFYCFLILFCCVFPLWGQILVTTANVHLRSESNTESNIICTVTKGSLVSIIEELEGWTKVSFNKKEGYICNSFLKLFNDPSGQGNTNNAYKYSSSTTNDSTKIKYYKNSQGEKVQSPTYYTKPPEGATAECRDGTYSFSKNRRGTCSHHGGVKRWLK